MDALTICAINYLPFAEILGNSFLDQNKNCTFTVLVIDAKDSNFKRSPRFNYLLPNQLEISENSFKNMSFYYDVTELATALKPSAIKKLLHSGSQKVIYLDPDIEVFSNFSDLDKALDNHSIILTPHTLTPIPRDGLRPSESDIMGSGTFNLGFIGIKNDTNSIAMLDWWEDRLRFDSISEPTEMLFTDQKWIDLVPSYFNYHTLRNPAYNVAYWNLHERDVEVKNSKFYVGNELLKFFHFSGYRPEKPWILSKYVSDRPRAVISKNQTLASLCESYSKKLTENGWFFENSTPYGFATFDDGKFIPSSLRRLYREDCIKAHKNGLVLEPPNNWRSWATERSIESGNLSRILFSLWKSRPDLMRRFPDATGSEANDLLHWASTHGLDEKVIDQEFLEIGGLREDNFPKNITYKKGLNISGYLKGELGLGQSARIIAKAAKNTKFPITLLNSNRSTSRQLELIDEKIISDSIYPVTISVVNADHFEFWVNDVGQKIASKTYVIGVWAWETEEFPKHMHSAFKYVDEIWAVSTFVKNAIQRHTKKPIYVYPNQISLTSEPAPLNRSQIGLNPDDRYNLFIFDYASVFNRKNPLGIVEAHKIAFPNEDGPLLVIKSTNGDNDAENRERLRFAVKDRKDIKLIENYMSREQLNSLLNECETYISLHRSEGYGLTMSEALSLRKPIIATGYSGNLDFLNSETCFLVPYKLVQVGFDAFPYLPETLWAEPDLEFAAIKMRELNANSEISEKFKTNINSFLKDNFTEEQATTFIEARLAYLFSARGRFKFFRKHLKLELNKLKTKIIKKLKNILH